MGIEKDAVKILAQEMKKVAKAVIDNAKFDKTVKGRIVSSLGNNKYYVAINNATYLALYHDNSLAIDDIVYVTIVQNDYNNMIIRLPIYNNKGGLL